MPAAGLHHAGRAEQRQRHHDDGNDGQLRTDRQHHQKDTDCSNDLHNDGGQVLADGIIDGIHVVGDHTENVAMGMGIVVVQFQPVHFPVNVASNLTHDIGSDLRHVETLQKGKELRYQIQAHQRRQQPENGFPIKNAVPDAVKQGRCDLADHKRGHHGENGADRSKQQDKKQPQPVAVEIPQQPFEGMGFHVRHSPFPTGSRQFRGRAGSFSKAPDAFPVQRSFHRPRPGCGRRPKSCSPAAPPE